MRKIDALSTDILNLKMPNNTDIIEGAVQKMSAEINSVGEELNKYKPAQEALISGKKHLIKNCKITYIKKIKLAINDGVCNSMMYSDVR